MRLEHFNKHEYEFVTKVNDWIHQVYYSHKIKKTKFLTPREQQVVQVLVNEFEDVVVRFEGGFKNAERKRAIIIPAYLSGELFDQTVVGYEVQYHHRLVTIEHRQVLGSLTALNIDRALVGDILVLETGKIYVAICEEFASFIMQYFTKVGRHPISLLKVDIKGLEKLEQYEENEYIISSMRLDVVVASLMKASRSEVFEYMKQGNIQLNFKLEQNHSYQCKIGDVISIKRYGRYKLLVQKSITKSGRIVVIIGKTV